MTRACAPIRTVPHVFADADIAAPFRDAMSALAFFTFSEEMPALVSLPKRAESHAGRTAAQIASDTGYETESRSYRNEGYETGGAP